MRPESLSEMQMDALREVGSIGAGHAATALSQLVDHPVTLTVPTLELVPVQEVPRMMGGPEKLVAAVHTRLLGDIGGGMLCVAEREDALALVDLLRGRPTGSAKAFGREEEALLTHAASILTAAYVAAVARLADVSLLPSAASFALDMAGAILQAVTTELGSSAAHALLVRTSFRGPEDSVNVGLVFIPDPDSLEVLLGRLGL